MKVLYNNVLLKIENTSEPVGVVCAAGEGRWEFGKWVHNEVREGDVVQFHPLSGIPITIKGEKYTLIDASDIIVIL